MKFKNILCVTAAVSMLFSAMPVMGAEAELSQITGNYSDAVVSEGIAGSSTTDYTGTENDYASIESVKTLDNNCIIITLDSYFPNFNISDLKLQAYNSDWYSLKASLQDRITYSDYNISVNSEGKTVIALTIDQNINNNRLESEYSDESDLTEDEISAALLKADYEITWQLDCGGWDKDYDLHVTREWNGTESKITHGWTASDGTPLGTIDNDATYSEMADIALAYALSGDEKYKESFEKGMEFLKDLQYESGGFAQVYPRRGNYSDYVTLNDDAMYAVLVMLEKIQDRRYPYNTGVVSDEYFAEIDTMLEKATDYLLKAQITCQGELSAWCAQHDPETYEPRPARAYELESISGSESMGAIKYLMNQWDNPEAVAAAEAAIKWFENHKMENTAFDKNATEDLDGDGIIDYFYYSEGSTLWYRFYDTETGVGFFSDRDGGKYYDISEISEERRTGYAWSGTWPAKLINVYNTVGYYADKIVVTVNGTSSADINGKTLLSGSTCSPTEDNLAYTLALNSSGESFLYGDADADGEVTASDAATVLQKTLNDSFTMPIEEKTDNFLVYVDVDANDEINAADAAAILQKVLNSSFVMNCETK